MCADGHVSVSMVGGMVVHRHAMQCMREVQRPYSAWDMHGLCLHKCGVRLLMLLAMVVDAFR